MSNLLGGHLPKFLPGKHLLTRDLHSTTLSSNKLGLENELLVSISNPGKRLSSKNHFLHLP